MTLEELLKNYGGNAGVSIDGYCEDSFNECLPDMKFWGKIKHRNVKTWNVIGAGNYPVELTIELEKPQEYAITDRSGDYICKGSYVVNGERYKVLNSSKQNSKVRVFKSREAAEREIERMQGRYVNASDLRACRIYRKE